MTQLCDTIEQWRQRRSKMTGSVGFVPTLGGLHEGHLSLIRRSLRENDNTVVSIFLNRVQFNDPNDCTSYPANFDDDWAAVRSLGVDVVLAPEFDAMYPDDYRYKVSEGDISRSMEGLQRPGHFDGVLTVVMKLLNIVEATKAYFGEKDYQQLELVKGMVAAYFMPVDIVGCPIVRASDGLALSSRNRKLSGEAREKAMRFPKILGSSLDTEAVRDELILAGFNVEYVTEQYGRRFGAVEVEGIRLIDNFPLSELNGDVERRDLASSVEYPIP